MGARARDGVRLLRGFVALGLTALLGLALFPDPGAAAVAPGSCVGRPNGSLCSDANACTQTDACQDGVCVGSNPAVCQCSNPVKANGSACNDGNACTRTDVCMKGICVGTNPVTCSAPDQCHVAGTCSPSTGACSNPAKANGSACNDGNACTQTD